MLLELFKFGVVITLIWATLIIGLLILFIYPDSGPILIAGGIFLVGAAAIIYRHMTLIKGGSINKLYKDDASGKAYESAPRGHKMESLMRHYINCYSKSSFVEVRGIDSSRLEWLNVPDTSAPNGHVYLDLDYYSPECKVAFEFNGPLHYKCPTTNPHDVKRWIIGRYNDKMKRKLCEDMGIKLYTITPDILDREYIMSRLFEANCLSSVWLTSSGERKGFSFIKLQEEKKYDHADTVDHITKVRRFGANAPSFDL